MAAELIETTSKQGRRRTIVAAIVVVVIPLLLYAPALRHDFVDYDDQYFLTENPTYNPPTFHGVMQYWRQPLRSLYQPIPYSIWGAIGAVDRVSDGVASSSSKLNPALFHAANILTHALASLLVFLLLRTILGGDIAPAAGALLFAVHPLQAEPVNWATNFFTVLSGALVMLCVWTYLLAARSTNPRRAFGLFVASAIVLVAAELSKPSAVVAPLIIATLLVFARSHDPVRKRLRDLLRLVWWLALVVPAIIIAARSQPAVYVQNVTPWMKPLVALDAIAFYLGKLVWPSGLTIDYGRSPEWLAHSSAWQWTWLVPILAITLAAWASRRGFRCALPGLLVTIVGVLPYLGLAKFEFQNISTVADRYVYAAMLGPALLLACALTRWPKLAPIAAVLLAALSGATIALSQTWANTDALMARALTVNPTSRIANGVLGYRAARAGNAAEAIARYQMVLDIDPTDPMTNYNFGNVLLAQGKFGDAADRYQIAVQRDPDAVQARTNLGVALMRLGQQDQAEKQFRLAVAQAPDSADAHANLGMCYLASGDIAAADRELRLALRLDPHNPTAARGLARIAQLPATTLNSK